MTGCRFPFITTVAWLCHFPKSTEKTLIAGTLMAGRTSMERTAVTAWDEVFTILVNSGLAGRVTLTDRFPTPEGSVICLMFAPSVLDCVLKPN